MEASDGDCFMVAPLEGVREGGDCREDETVEVGVKEGLDLDDSVKG
jgi:TATA-binding protein-associated factor Taf7